MAIASTLPKPPTLSDAVAVWRMHLTGDPLDRIVRDSGFSRHQVEAILAGELHLGSEGIARSQLG